MDKGKDNEWWGHLIDHLEAQWMADIDLDRAHKILHSAWRILFIGNGGSATIASHMAVDFSKHGEVPALALNDPATLTCIANDYGYEEVFSRQISWYANSRDVLVAISSSGMSANILRGVSQFRLIAPEAQIITLSGFSPDNYLRNKGAVNFWVDSTDYGIIETVHSALLHSLVKP